MESLPPAPLLYTATRSSTSVTSPTPSAPKTFLRNMCPHRQAERVCGIGDRGQRRPVQHRPSRVTIVAAEASLDSNLDDVGASSQAADDARSITRVRHILGNQVYVRLRTRCWIARIGPAAKYAWGRADVPSMARRPSPTQWQKGQSSNPGGRPKKDHALIEALENIVDKEELAGSCGRWHWRATSRPSGGWED